MVRLYVLSVGFDLIYKYINFVGGDAGGVTVVFMDVMVAGTVTFLNPQCIMFAWF